jgi:hypothetical protein
LASAAACLLATAAAVAYAQVGSGERSVTILYTGAAFGRLTPYASGADGGLGGLARRDAALAQLQRRFPGALLLDAGGSFAEPTASGRSAAEALLAAFRALGYGAVAIGPADLAYGREFLEERASAGLFVSNLTYKQPAMFAGPARAFTRGGVTVRVLALVEPSAAAADARAAAAVTPPAGYLTSHPASGALTVVLCSTKRDSATALAAHPQADVVINANPDGELNVEPPFRFQDGKVYTEAAIYGSRIGVLELRVNGPTVLAAQNSQVALDKSFADGVRVKPILDAFAAKTK